jgi:hypothetical protein
MKKTIAALAASTAIAVAVVFAPAAGAQPVGGCPSGDSWNLVGLDETLDRDVGNLHDQNGDGFVCQRDNRGLSMKHDATTWTVKDNTNPLSEV